MFERCNPEARQAIILAQTSARRLHHDFIGTEHLLLGLLYQPEALAAALLTKHGLDGPTAEATILRLLGCGEPEADSLDADALRAIGIDLSMVRERVEAAFGPGALDRAPARTGGGRVITKRNVPFTDRAKKVIELSLRESLRLKHSHITDAHLLLGVLREGRGLAARVIADAGIDFAGLRGEVERRLAPPPA